MPHRAFKGSETFREREKKHSVIRCTCIRGSTADNKGEVTNNRKCVGGVTGKQESVVICGDETVTDVHEHKKTNTCACVGLHWTLKPPPASDNVHI